MGACAAIVGLSANNVEVLDVNLQATSDRFEIGDLTRTDVAQSESRLALARGDLRSTQANLIAAREDYIELVGEALADQFRSFVPADLARHEEQSSRGLDAVTVSARGGEAGRVRDALDRLRQASVKTSLFIDPDPEAIEAAAELGADAIELHTGSYANAWSPGRVPADELERLRAGAARGAALGLHVHAGHGLTYENVAPVAAIPEIEELNIGHSIVSRSVFTGMERAVRDMVELVRLARS